MNECDNPDAIFLNPAYLKKLEKEEEEKKKSEEQPKPIEQVVDTPLSSDSQQHIENIEVKSVESESKGLLKGIVDFLFGDDPTETSAYQHEEQRRKNKVGNPDEDEPSKGWKIFIPLFSKKF